MSSKTWFNKSDLLLSAPIILDDLHGYVLPHASTKYTGHILSHTLRFKPNKIIKNIIINITNCHPDYSCLDNLNGDTQVFIVSTIIKSARAPKSMY